MEKFKCPRCGRAYSCPTCGRPYKSAEEVAELINTQKSAKCQKCKTSFSVAVGAALKKLARRRN